MRTRHPHLSTLLPPLHPVRYLPLIPNFDVLYSISLSNLVLSLNSMLLSWIVVVLVLVLAVAVAVVVEIVLRIVVEVFRDGQMRWSGWIG